MPLYTPDADANYCIHCGQVYEAHHSDYRCYTTDELVSRLRVAQWEGRWPGTDEGCEEETAVQAPRSPVEPLKAQTRLSGLPHPQSRQNDGP